MPRLPLPGSDQGTWGDILNDYLSAAHKEDGTLKDSSVSVANLSQELKDKIDIVAGQQGATGAVGATGASGPAGSQGPSGTPGTPGTNGATGATGASGTPGIPGATGASGAQGLQGPSGLQGIQGITGATGAQGASGTPGTNGATGATGPQGTPGTTGATGATGAASTVPGPTGATGPAGQDGTSVTITGSVASASALPTGLTLSDAGNGYLTNDNGHLHVWSGSAWTDVGEIRGPQGMTGASGAQGATGAASTIPGATGATGASGTNGSQGATGAQGPSGASGTPGTAGATGATGPVSTVPGPTGATGAAGATTWAGITDKPAVIAAGTSATVARNAIGAAPATGISLDATTDAADRLAMTTNERTKLANLTGTVYITTTGATLPEDLADGTLIARYTASGPATPVVTDVGTALLTTTATSISVTTTAAIPVGDIIAVAVNRGTGTAGQVMGSAVASLSTGAVDSWTRNSASRAATADTALLTARVTTVIPAGSTVTVTTSTNNTNRAAMIVAGIHNLSSGVPAASSGDAAAGQSRDENHGPNANGVSLIASTSAATTVAHTLILGAFGIGGTATYTNQAPQTEVNQLRTSVGSADRGITLSYKVVSMTGVQSMTINSSPSSGITGVVVALPIEMLEV